MYNIGDKITFEYRSYKFPRTMGNIFDGIITGFRKPHILVYDDYYDLEFEILAGNIL